MAPLINAAKTIGEGLSLQQYGLDWFAGGGVPKAWMRNARKTLQDEAREGAKQWYADTIRNGDVLVTGADWEYNMIQAEQAGMEWLEGRRFGVAEICRFFGVPPEMVHGAISGQSITYANVTQANLQFLIMNLGPAVIRRERSLTNLLPQPRYVKLNTDALLRLDPQTRQEMIRSRLETWQITNKEARALDNLAPLNAADLAEMQEIYGKPKIAGGGGAAPPGQNQDQPAEGGDGQPAEPATPEPAAKGWTPEDSRRAFAWSSRLANSIEARRQR
jgi:HK97 family phage portal protein